MDCGGRANDGGDSVGGESDEDLEDNEEEPQPHGTAEEEEESEIVQSDLEFKGETVEPDNDMPQKVTEENWDAAQDAKAKAMEAISEGKPEEAIEHLTQAILLNPTLAIMLNSMHKKLRNTVGSMRSCAKNERKERSNVRDNVVMLKLRTEVLGICAYCRGGYDID
ncbi:FAM10 family protein [Camellia lanceoleosa]|uniref:FAM10 family protein n=1 Tax=Camellia lanceoleosa TaxID=1840588 RepID=A0ACC0HFH7_9ERIC|nr:FAM10 family protein [Camellia lanceoleosa]